MFCIISCKIQLLGNWVLDRSVQSTDTPSRRSASLNIWSESGASVVLPTLVWTSRISKTKKICKTSFLNTPNCQGHARRMWMQELDVNGQNTQMSENLINLILHTFLLPPIILCLSFAPCLKPWGRGTGAARCWAQPLFYWLVTVLLHGGDLCGNAVLSGISFDSRAAGGVSGQTGAALATMRVQVQVITDVRLSVTLFLWNI